ncbi:MAG: SET domain-containing protein [Sandaracinaceae bacterium]
MLHPSTRLSWISDAVGYGVRATRRIPKGTILWALDPLDRVFGPQEVQHLGEGLWPVLETYSYVNGSGKRVLCWDHGRFMNHSCEPVSLSPGVDFELAVRDIEEGEEITCDYTSLNSRRSSTASALGPVPRAGEQPGVRAARAGVGRASS